MAKGFTKDGKFRPTGNNGKKSSRDKSITPDGSSIKTVKFKVWKYEDAPDDLQEKILENQRNSIAEDSDNFFAEDEGLIFDKDEKKDGSDIGLKNLFPENFSVGANRGDDFVQFDLSLELFLPLFPVGLNLPSLVNPLAILSHYLYFFFKHFKIILNSFILCKNYI